VVKEVLIQQITPLRDTISISNGKFTIATVGTNRISRWVIVPLAADGLSDPEEPGMVIKSVFSTMSPTEEVPAAEQATQSPEIEPLHMPVDVKRFPTAIAV